MYTDLSLFAFYTPQTRSNAATRPFAYDEDECADYAT